MDKGDFYEHTFHVNSSLPRLVGGGVSHVRGSDPKGLNVAAVGLDIRLEFRPYYGMFPGWGVKTRRGYRI